MKVDLDGRVKNLDLPVSKPLLPLLEAITNSFNKPLNTYIEVITFDKLVRDARLRNRVLFKKMGVDEKLLKSEMLNVKGEHLDHQ